ncbi:MAG: hypothetical protein S4CHLAM45_12320 [Chlamydiales bacterium]|nr:hypothetical protein [Chlamydiales bacterium]MCH9619721.1 hypothetical protein [Chlamydiales bacterium]MCH9623327.1 hypothetical protein [Chlamydiales bacterium]
METKLFAGVRLTSEMRGATQVDNLEVITFEGKEYIGLYTDKNPTLTHVHELSDQITSTLHKCLPDAPPRFSVRVFPQLFIG